MEACEPVVLLCNSGTGKTHLLIGLGIVACERGLRLVARYGRFDLMLLDLMLLDELAYVHLDQRGANLLFQVLTEREERASVAVASNAPFSEWGMTFTDARLAAAVVDRRRTAMAIKSPIVTTYRLLHLTARRLRTMPGLGATFGTIGGTSLRPS